MRAKYLAAIAAVSLTTAGGAAGAQTAQPLSLANSPTARAGAGTSGASSLDRRGYGIYIVGAVILGLIVWGIIELANNNNNMPSSP